MAGAIWSGGRADPPGSALRAADLGRLISLAGSAAGEGPFGPRLRSH